MAKKNRNNPYYKHTPTVSVRRIIHHILSFVLTMLILFMAGSLSTITGFLNDTGIRKAVENQEFYEGVRENIIEQCRATAIPSMIDEDIFYSVFTKERIASDVKSYIADSVQGREHEFELDDLEATMEQAIKDSLEEQKITVNAEIQKDIKTYIDEEMQIYKSTITISYIEDYVQIKGTVRPIAVVLFSVSLVLTIAILFLMIAMYKFRVIHKTIRMFAYALGGAGLVLTGVFAYFKIVKIGSGLQIVPEFLYEAMQRYIQNGLGTYIFGGVILIIFSLGLAFVSEALRVRVKKNYFARLESNFRESLNDELENKNFTPDLDMTSREEKAKKVAHDEFNRYAMDRLSSINLNEETERVEADFDLPQVNIPQDDFTEVNVEDDEN